MSKIWSAESASAVATPVGGFGDFGTLGRQGGGFRTLYGDDSAARPWTAGAPGRRQDSAPVRDEGPAVDPIEEAAREAFLQGFQEGDRIARESIEADNEARIMLANAVQHIAQTGEGTLATMLSQAVIRLVGQIMGEVEIDEAVLKERCAAVAACIDSDDHRAVLEVNPEDMHLLEEEATGITLSANPALQRGSVRLATADGWVEDGPDIRLERLKSLLDDMEGRR
ncbi:MAG: flagellar biosynthesis protein [Sphingobium sp.]|nr:flagellar biosynthesis protein [Sphingobium sp.]